MTVMFIKDMQARHDVKEREARSRGEVYQNPVSSPAYSLWATENAGLLM